MDFALLPPEINSGRIYAGPGSGPMLAAAAAWDGLASDLQSTAASYQSAISGLTSGPWLGPSSVAMAAAATPYVSWMSTTAIQAVHAAAQAKMAAGAYEAAFAMTVAPPVIAANRELLMSLVATNFLGQNTAAIAATEAHYMEMWAQDAAAMYGYAGTSASASTLTPFTPAPDTTNPAGLAGQAAAVAQRTATSAGTGAQTIVSTSPQLLSAVPTALQGLASPLSSTSAAAPTSGLLGILQSLDLTSPSTIIEPASLATASGAWASASQGDEEIQNTQLATAAEFSEQRDVLTNKFRDWGDRMMNRFDQLGTVESAGSAGLGRAAPVGALSVPPGWTTAAPAIRLATVALPALPVNSLGAAPEVFAGSPGTLLSEIGLAGMAGRAMGGTVGLGRRERVGVVTPERVAPPQRAPGGLITGIAAELRELAELHDSQVLTDEEFSELKQRVLAS